MRVGTSCEDEGGTGGAAAWRWSIADTRSAFMHLSGLRVTKIGDAAQRFGVFYKARAEPEVARSASSNMCRGGGQRVESRGIWSPIARTSCRKRAFRCRGS